MSNTTDLFQADQKQLATAVASASVVVDEVLRPDLEPIEIIRGAYPDFSRARLAYNPAASTSGTLKTAEEITAEFAAGKRFAIQQYYNGVAPGVATFDLPIFCGHVESVETRLSPEGESVEIIARDFGANMQRLSVHGQRLAEADGSNLFLAGLDVVFNPNCRGNAASAPTEVADKKYTLFCADTSRSRLWSCAEVIDYLLCEHVLTGQLLTPTLDQLKALTESQIVRDLDVTELNLAEALHRCCKRIGLEFKFMPRLAPTGPDQVIVFYRPNTGRTVELNCQQSGQQLSISKTNIAALYSSRNFWPVTHRYIGQGDFKVYESTFELVGAWDPNLEGTDHDKYSPTTNSDFYQVKDVYRKWCLNEAGRYTEAPYDQGSVFDFSKVFESDNFSHRNRRFHPALTTDKLGRSLGYFLQVSCDNGSNWWQYLYAFNILLDECGVWLSSDQLDSRTWFSALRGFLKFRITASVVGDERLTAVVADGPVNSTAPVIEHIMTLPRQFKYRKISSQSIFANSADDTLGVADEADDSRALQQFVRQTAATSPEIVETFDVQTPILTFDYQIGDMVTTSPESRDLLACRNDNRSSSRVVEVQMDFQKQCVNLKIVRQRNRQL